MENAIGYRKVEVTHEDGNQEQVSVRQLKLRQLPRYAEIVTDEAACVELFCGKEPGWADTLTLESAERVLLIGHELNEVFLKRSVERAAALRDQIQPGWREREKEVVEQLMAQIAGSMKPTQEPSTTPSLKPSRSPAEATTKSST